MCLINTYTLVANPSTAFGENLMLTAHPSKSGSDWWYGTVVRDGKKGFFPKTYVERVEIGRVFYDH